MRKFFTTRLVAICFAVLYLVFAISISVFAEDAASTATSTDVFTWFAINGAAVLGVLLAISELLALMPWFKGNGILDSIIKGLKFLGASKPNGSASSGS